MIVVVTLTLTAAAIAGGLLLTSLTERQIAATHRMGVALGYAADAAAQRVVSALDPVADWTDVPGTWTAGSVAVTTSIQVRTDELNRAVRSRFPLGANTPSWRPVRSETGPVRTTVWVADDPADADGTPARDSNGVVMLRAEASGPRGSTRAIDIWLARTGGVTRVVAWREVE